MTLAPPGNAQRSSRVSAEVLRSLNGPALLRYRPRDRNYITAEMNDLDDLEKWGRDLGVLRGLEACNKFKCRKFPFVFRI
jgi:hypothetical protein